MGMTTKATKATKAKEIAVIEPDAVAPLAAHTETSPPAAKITEPKPKTVRVLKKANDSMTSFCGEPVKTSETGRESFDLMPFLKPMVDQNPNLVWPADEE
jgi:hypothetical protein